jgi:hypothetical protein
LTPGVEKPPVVAERLPLAEARHAHELLESSAERGTLVLVPRQDERPAGRDRSTAEAQHATGRPFGRRTAPVNGGYFLGGYQGAAASGHEPITTATFADEHDLTANHGQR